MKVKVAEIRKGEYVVIVPYDYCNSAANIDDIAKAVKSEQEALWHILQEDDFLDAEI